MDTVTITSTDTEKSVKADVIQRSEKRLVVSPKGTDLRLTLTRADTRRPYIGFMHGVEFLSKG